MSKLAMGWLVAFTSWCFCGALRADLAWEQTKLSFHPAVADTEVIAHFKFQNTGVSDVAIRSVATACSCATATASKKSYAAGEKGEIVVKFQIEDRAGVQKMEIDVETDDTGGLPSTLTMEVTVPKIAVVEPELLSWMPGDSLQPKRIHVTAARGVAMKLCAVKPSDPGAVSARIEPGARVGEFEIVVTPSGDRPAFSGVLRLETDFPKEHPKALWAHVQVTR